MMKMAALLWIFGALPPLATPLTEDAVATADAACGAVKTRVAARENSSESIISFCDFIPVADSPEGYFVLALHSRRECEGPCSTNMGWFAVRKSTGDVFEWNVADWAVGPPVSRR